jgi:hypothetical protein
MVCYRRTLLGLPLSDRNRLDSKKILKIGGIHGKNIENGIHFLVFDALFIDELIGDEGACRIFH